MRFRKWMMGALAVLLPASATLAADEERPSGLTAINIGLSGVWFIPSAAGQGFKLDVVPGQQVMAVAWATFGRGNPAPHRWFWGAGSATGLHVVVPLLLTQGGAFSAPPAAPSQQVGELQIDFISCTQATVTYELREQALSETGDPTSGPLLHGTLNIERLLPDPRCEALSTPAAKEASA